MTEAIVRISIGAIGLMIVIYSTEPFIQNLGCGVTILAAILSSLNEPYTE